MYVNYIARVIKIWHALYSNAMCIRHIAHGTCVMQLMLGVNKLGLRKNSRDDLIWGLICSGNCRDICFLNKIFYFEKESLWKSCRNTKMNFLVLNLGSYFAVFLSVGSNTGPVTGGQVLFWVILKLCFLNIYYDISLVFPSSICVGEKS